MGKPGRFLACLFMFVYNFGILCANLLVVGSAVPALLVAITGTDHLAFHREYPQFPLQSPSFFFFDVSYVRAAVCICYHLTSMFPEEHCKLYVD